MKRFVYSLKSLAKKLPGVGRLLERMEIAQRYKIERMLINNTHHTSNTHPSILHFTVNKAASQHVLQVLSLCGGKAGMSVAQFHAYSFETGIIPMLGLLPQEKLKKYHYLFKPTGYVYSAFNRMLEGLPDFDRYKVILMIRDPRDVLVSAYFSYAYSHSAPLKSNPQYFNFIKMREKLQNMTVDEYARSSCESVRRTYEQYDLLLMKKFPSLVYFTKYEEMTADYPRWLRGLLDYTELNISSALFDDLVRQNEQSRPVSENVYKHRRRGRPGEHREKLSKETIAYLDANLRGVLAAFCYNGV